MVVFTIPSWLPLFSSQTFLSILINFSDEISNNIERTIIATERNLINFSVVVISKRECNFHVIFEIDHLFLNFNMLIR